MKTFVGVTLSPELAELLRERAERNNRTIAGELREILGAAIKPRGDKSDRKGANNE